MPVDRGYDADWFRNALIARGIEPCIPSRANRKDQIPQDTGLYRQRHRNRRYRYLLPLINES
jgi:transposase